MTEPDLLTPFAEAETGLELEQPLDRALARAGKFRQLGDRSSIGRLLRNVAAIRFARASRGSGRCIASDCIT